MVSRKRGKRTGGIDPATGAVTLDDWDTALGPELTVKAFLASALGKAAKPVMGNELILYFGLPWCRISGTSFGISVIFRAREKTLETLLLELSDDELKLAKRSADIETERNAAHYRWLKEQLGSRALPSGEWKFPWGTIEARWVAKNDESWIIIDYDKPQAGARRERGSLRHPSRRGRGRRA
jgi:hypothetical protein